MDITEIQRIKERAEQGTASHEEIREVCNRLIDALCELETLKHGAEK